MVGLTRSLGESRSVTKAGKLEREDLLGIEGRADDGDTLGIIAAGHTQHRSDKIVNGDDGNDVVEVIGEEPEGAGTQEGTRMFVGGNTTASIADPGLDQGFEVDASQAGVGGNTDRKATPTARKHGSRREIAAGPREETPEARTLDTAAG
jgi:hypothetical protein